MADQEGGRMEVMMTIAAPSDANEAGAGSPKEGEEFMQVGERISLPLRL